MKRGANKQILLKHTREIEYHLNIDFTGTEDPSDTVHMDNKGIVDMCT
jgi:hypothetical protein